MNDSILVNLHCHSHFSDGDQPPEAVAALLAAAGVRCGALTDHDSIEGLPRFQEALQKHAIACLTGVELTTYFEGRIAHLLGYGFDPQHPELAATLFSLRQGLELDVHSIAGSLRNKGANHAASAETQAVSAAPNGRLEIGQAIALIHRAGGRAFWAHPLVYETDLERLDSLLSGLKSVGLDGVEALYAPFSEAQRAALYQLAHQHGLLICAGTDFHTQNDPSNQSYAIEMPRADWNRFRSAVLSGPVFRAGSSPSDQSTARAASPAPGEKHHTFRRRSYVLRILLPTLIALALFLAVTWGFILPSFENSLLERKRELIRELTNTAWSILASYERDEQNGTLTREQAQAMAIARIEALRYGPEGKDYFWIQDMQPRMIMHPYRSDLNGQGLENFTDPRGAPIFVEFANLVRRENEGYIHYVWQWKDDPARLEPKESYVKGFEPWGWVIGTGLYTDDVHNEIARIEQNLINTSLAISGAVILLLVFVLQQSLRIEFQRQEVVDTLRDSTRRYQMLIEATSEGTLLILEDRCRYANPIFLGMTGYTARQMEFLELADLLPRWDENQTIWEQIDSAPARRGAAAPSLDSEAFDGVLLRTDGKLLGCTLALSPIEVGGENGYILLARDYARQQAALEAGNISHAAQSAPVGIFRARATRRAPLIEMNPAARAVFSSPQPALADLFSDPTEFEAIFQTLQDQRAVNQHIIYTPANVGQASQHIPDASARYLSLSARLVQDEHSQTTYSDCILQDVTAARRQEVGREAVIERLQASLLFLHEPISRLGREVLVCDLHTTIAQLARLMTLQQVTAALVSSEVAGETKTILGIVTDHDLRARALAENIAANAPVHTIMSAPLTKIPEDALIYEALMRMEEKGVRHLAVEARDGHIVSVIDSKSLVQFQRYGPIVLAREISRAGTAVEVALCTGRTPPLVKTLLDSSVRPRPVTGMLASVCDAATERLVQLAIDELGAPPTPFALIAMGSQGRQEQTLVTDQDNGIIFTPPQASELPAVNDYFLRLGAIVCAGLDRAGYSFCRGGVMASNPRWCRSLPAWISGFEEWIQKSEPQEIIDLSIFFDFRTVYGDADLTHELRRSIFAILGEQPGFFPHLAQNALAFKPPFRLLGNIYLSGGATEHAGEINLKDAMMPMVSFARLYALRYAINQTHTIERIEALAERAAILPSSRDEIVASYDFLMQLRLQTQIAAIQSGRNPTNLIHPNKLGYIQQESLKQAFAQIAAVQKKLSYDFLGGI